MLVAETKNYEVTREKIGQWFRWFVDGKDGQSYGNYECKEDAIEEMNELEKCHNN